MRKVMKKISGTRKDGTKWYGVVIAASVNVEKKTISRAETVFLDDKEDWDAIEEGVEYSLK